MLVPKLDDLVEPDVNGVALNLNECRSLIAAHGMRALLFLILDLLDL